MIYIFVFFLIFQLYENIELENFDSVVLILMCPAIEMRYNFDPYIEYFYFILVEQKKHCYFFFGLWYFYCLI